MLPRVPETCAWSARRSGTKGLEGFDKRPAGTGSYRYVERKLGKSILFARVDNHWRGKKPEFPELEIRISREDATRLALLLNGEAHIVDLPRELQPDAVKKGMKILSSQLATDWLSIYMGGQFHLPGDPKFKADVPWNDKRVRQALNLAIDRKELLNTIFRGKGAPMYVSGYQPYLEGWNPAWPERSTTPMASILNAPRRSRKRPAILPAPCS